MELCTLVSMGLRGYSQRQNECKNTSIVSTGGMDRSQLPLALALLSHCTGVLAGTVLPNVICIRRAIQIYFLYFILV